MTRGVAKESFYLSIERFQCTSPGGLLVVVAFKSCAPWRIEYLPSQRHVAPMRMNEYAMRINIPRGEWIGHARAGDPTDGCCYASGSGGPISQAARMRGSAIAQSRSTGIISQAALMRSKASSQVSPSNTFREFRP